MDELKTAFSSWVAPLELTPVQSIQDHQGRVAGYGSEPAIQRYFTKSPLYTAVHVIKEADEGYRDYGVVHSHPFPEINILAGGPNELIYRIRVGEEEHEVASPAAITIPPGVLHSANLVRGRGSFVVLRLTPEQLEYVNNNSV